MTYRSLFIAAALATTLASSAWAATTREPSLQDRQQAACADDAQRLCGDVMPDVDKVSACMKVKRAQVSAKCAKMYGTTK